jgi:class 3 adenylate cyclase/DNA-binding CsgD family transcriptional regulator/tetratricopeptide (TPR) repeat protein
VEADMPATGTATATILFADAVRSTDLRVRLGEIAADRLFRDLQHQLSTIVAGHRGRTVKAAGDGVIAAFEAASDAITAAVAMQQDVHRDLPDVQLRIGAAAGDVSWEDGDCFGLPVITAARLESAARPGSILVTNVVRALAGDRATSRYDPAGSLDLQGLPEPVEVFTASWEPLRPATTSEALPLPPLLTVASGVGFVGRVAEWEVLAGAWADVQEGHRRILLVGGEAGAGKTRLAAEFARWCHEQGAAILLGGCDSDLAAPYQPWAQALDHLVRHLSPEVLSGGIRDDLGELVVLLPHLERVVPRTRRPRSEDPEDERFVLFSGVASVLDFASERQPVVLVLDDLHWAGTQTLGLLRHLARVPIARRLLVIGTFRDTGDEITDPLAACLADLRRLEDVRRVRLGGLDERSVEDFVALAAGQDLDVGLRQLAATVSDRTGGNAFFVGELWRHLIAVGAVVRAGGRWRVQSDEPDTAVPDGVREVVADRLHRLSAEGRSLALLAAVAGQRIELRVLADATEVERPAVEPALDELVEAGFLAPPADRMLTYQFTHVLVRDTVADTLAPAARARLHLRVAEALERVHEADRRPVLADLARHFSAAAALGQADRAVYYCRRAAMQATRAAAHEEAVSHLQAALQFVTPGVQRVELLTALGEVQVRRGLYLPGASIFCQAFDDAVELGEIELAAQAALGFEQAMHMPGLSGVELVERARNMLGDGETPLHARLLASLARALSHAGRSEEALATVESAISMARRTNDPDTLGRALQAALIATSDPDRLLELVGELTDLCAVTTDPWHELYATSNQLRALFQLGRLDEAREVLDRHWAMAEQGRFAAFQTIGYAYEVVLALARGHFAEAEQAAERAHSLGLAGNAPFDAGVYGLQMFVLRREQGRLAEVAPVVELLTSRVDGGSMWRPGLAALHAELGRLDDARRELDVLAVDGFAAVPRDALWPACANFLAEVSIALGDPTHAEALLRELSAFRGQNLMAGMTICLGPADRLLGALSLVLGHLDAASAHLEQALALAERSGSPVWRARVLHDQARCHEALGDPAGAHRLGTEAQTLAAEIGMAGLAARPVPGSAGLRLVPSRPAPAGPLGLSLREVDVLRLVASGCSNREIGSRLYISPNTAANHVRAILQKTGCANRAEAAAFAARHDLLVD